MVRLLLYDKGSVQGKRRILGIKPMNSRTVVKVLIFKTAAAYDILRIFRENKALEYFDISYELSPR